MSTKNESYEITAENYLQHLSKMGWSGFFQNQLVDLTTQELHPARVVGVSKNSFRVSDGRQEWLATIAGRLNYLHGQYSDLYPVAGDWVLMNDAVISAILERKNALSRGAAGTRGKQDALPRKEQIIAANIDTVFIVCGLDRDFNPRRIERYLTLVYNCGLTPVIILTKADLHKDAAPFVSEVEMTAFGVPVHSVSALDDSGLTSLEAYLTPGRTITLIGSSGAGKSTLVNRLYGKTVQATGSVSASVGKGTHTTTSRDLIMMPQGGMIIDNPGIREIALMGDRKGVNSAFPEIEELAASCRFSDCSHMHEPGCRVLQAVEAGEISPGRLASYQKMKREKAYTAGRLHKSADRLEKERWKDVALKIKAIKKAKRTK